MYRNHLKLGACAAAIALAAGSAHAQTAVEQVTVTGSRIVSNGNDMPIPVTVVSPETLTQTVPSNIMDGLQALPVFAGGRSPQVNPGNSSQNNAAHQFNLRNVGITRTLVLFDGRRIAPTSPTGEVNADIIPQMLLQRVDVVTGGASAVYGSDAVTGVVNFITDKNFNGIKIKGHAGASELWDGMEQNLGIAGGMDILGGRGHIEASYEWFNNEGIAWNDKLKRDWAKKVWTVQGAGSAANPLRLVQNTRLSSTSFSGVILSGPLTYQQFNLNHVLGPYVHGTPTGGNGVESGGDGGYYYQASLVSKLKSHQLFGRFDYEVADNIHAHIEAAGTKSNNQNNHQTNEFRNINLSATNAFLDPAYQQAMLNAGTSTFRYSKMMTQAPPLQPNSWTTAYLVNAGLDGTFGRYRWETSFVYNANQQYTRNNANIDLQRAYAALDAVRDPGGNVVCNVTLTNPGLYPGCVPLDLFGPTSESQKSLDYILKTTNYYAQTNMADLGGSIAGSPFDNWAGPVEFALSAEWRQTTYDLTSDAQPVAANCTGLRFNCTASTLKYISNVLGDVHNLEQSVWETALETEVPLLKDVPLVQSLSLNGAARYTSYDTSGTVWTWKLGGTWAVNDELSFRATRSRDIRAPNLNELFAPTLINPAGVQDIHTGIVGQAPFYTFSNPNLRPEVAITTTAGVVYRPEWFPSFSLAIDYYKIKIGNAITTLQGQNPTIQNLCEASNGTSPFCDMIHRPLPFSDRSPANFVTQFDSLPQNYQSVVTEGVDIEANYQTDVGPGHLALRALGSYQPMLKTIQFPGAPVLNTASTPGQPSFRSSLFIKYTWDDISIDILERIHSGTKWNSDRSLIYAEPDFPWAAYTNLSITYDWQPAELYLTISNLFDKQPTPYGNNGGSSGVPGLFGGFVPLDDAIGRYYTVGFRLRLD